MLDVGCGLGGACRFAAVEHGCRVTGIDLTPEFVEVGEALTGWVGLDDRVSLRQGNATEMPFEKDSFDRAFMLHAGMNITDKAALAAEVARVLRPAGMFGVYDVMRVGPGDPTYPVPWADRAEASALATPREYAGALEAAGFEVGAPRFRGEFALEFFERLRGQLAAEGPPELGLHLVMGEDMPTKLGNMIEAIADGRIAPVELRAWRPPAVAPPAAATQAPA